MSPTSSVPEYHVLNFFYDDEDNCALTALIEKTRFHVIADASNVRHGKVGQEYARLLQAVKEDGVDDDVGMSSDSGVDVSTDGKLNALKDESAEEHLHRWMLAPLQSKIEGLAMGKPNRSQQTLSEWFSTTTFYFNLEARDRELQAIELEENGELEGRMRKLTPQLSVPKYIQETEVPWYKATDLIVLSCSDSPAPYHPCRVLPKGQHEPLFLKLVDSSQPQPTKREISILKKIADMGLHEKVRCPMLEGIVTLDGDHRKILGFLQSDIPNPVPLTWKFDIEVPQRLRDRWAAESQDVKELLHDHGIIWGDAKADNFMVDEYDQLWIIDFGGSYTEGWVDPEMKETEEGDDMGVEKIANALHDPVENVWDPDTEKSYGGRSCESKKRKASDSPGDASKRQKQNTENDELYCYCRSSDSGRMIACDNKDCARQWFHFDCVGLEQAPADHEKWFCDECISPE